MTNLQASAEWPDVRQLETHEFARGGLNGNMNEQAKSLLARTEFLRNASNVLDKRTGSFISGSEFGLKPNILDDQTEKFDVFSEYLRTTKKKGLLEAGCYIVSCNKTKTFGIIAEANYREEKYAVDISGCDIEGINSGYRNVNGTIIKCLNQDGTALMQAQTSASLITHRIKNIKVENSKLCLRFTYSVGSSLENFYFDNTNLNGIALGDATLAMPLLNRFKSINGECVDRPLITDGKGGCNLNYFEEIYVMGDLPSKINATGGYGAISNLFISSEFASRVTGTTGLELGNTKSTTLINPYFEAHKNCIELTGSTVGLKLVNPILSGMAEYNVAPAFILHNTTAVCDVSIDGGHVFANELDNTRLFDSIDATKLYINIVKPPQVTQTKTGYKVIDLDKFKKLAGFSGIHEDSFSITWSASGATPSGFTTANCSFSTAGKQCTVTYNLVLSNAMILPAGSYFPDLPRPSKASTYATSSLKVRKENIVDGRTEPVGQIFVDSASSLAQLLLQQITAIYNDTTKTVAIKNTSTPISNTALTGYENPSFLRGSVTYIMS